MAVRLTAEHVIDVEGEDVVLALHSGESGLVDCAASDLVHETVQAEEVRLGSIGGVLNRCPRANHECPITRLRQRALSRPD